MSKNARNRNLTPKSIEPAHPGEMLAEITIPATGKSKAEIAKLYQWLTKSAVDGHKLP